MKSFRMKIPDFVQPRILVITVSINLMLCILIVCEYGNVLFRPFGKMDHILDTSSRETTGEKFVAHISANNNHSQFTRHSAKAMSLSDLKATKMVGVNDKPNNYKPVSSNHSYFNSVKPVPPSESKGYVIPYDIYEQQTSAARNLWGLQLWAHSAGMKVAEPFFSDYGMSFQALVNGTTNPYRFSDFFDREFWNSKSTVNGCAELIEWEEVLRNAPRKTILVLPWGYKNVSVEDYKLVDVIDDPSRIVGQRTCGPVYFSELAMKYFNGLGFYYVREVCIKFKPDVPLTMEQFTHYIFDQHRPSDVTVIFAYWQGVRPCRINLLGVKLTKDNTINVGLLPSKKIVQESDKYLRRFITPGRKYFGVMIRLERTFLWFTKSHGYAKVLKYMAQCASQLAELQQFKDHREWSRTLAIDMGSLGSRGCLLHDNHCPNKLLNPFLIAVFGKDGWGIEEYEGSFKKYHNPAYVAHIQRTIAARSDCLVMVGGKSNFQSATISFYKNFHPNVTEQCIIYHCYYQKNFNIDSV